MKVFDTVNKEDLELDYDGLVEKINSGRQVDLILGEKKDDGVGYMTWDEEHWVSLDAKRYVCTYTLEGRQLNDYTSHNRDDLYNEFHPEKAKEVTLS